MEGIARYAFKIDLWDEFNPLIRMFGINSMEFGFKGLQMRTFLNLDNLFNVMCVRMFPFRTLRIIRPTPVTIPSKLSAVVLNLNSP